MLIRTLTVCLLALAHSLAPIARADDAGPSLQDIKQVVAPGTPGELAVWGPSARVLVAGTDDGLLTPVVASATFGPRAGTGGRVVAFAHTGFLDGASMQTLDTALLIERAILWSAKHKGDNAPSPRLGLLNCSLADFAKARGWPTVKLDGKDWPKRVTRNDLDVICLVGNALDDSQIEVLTDFVRAGGGLLAAQTAWAWNAQPGKSILENPLNRIFAGAGIAWTQGYTAKTTDQGFAVSPQTDPLLHAGAALDALISAPANTPPTDSVRLAASTATTAARVLPSADTLLRPRIIALVNEHAAELVPTAATPLRERSPLQRTLLAMQIAHMAALAPENTTPHPAAATFPGSVPTGAQRVSRQITINTAIPEWHSTGLYAAPGDTITITVPLPASKAKLQARIGCHKDTLYKHSKWERVPEITRAWPITAPTTAIASPFGGPIYLDIPDRCPLGTITVTIAGAVEAPLFILGTTTPQEWNATIRTRPAPWAELATSKVIISVPSSAIRALDDPETLLKYWDSILDAAADLATIPRERARPERYVPDQQISAGYMHSGYPIMTHLDAVDDMVSVDKLKKGTWGLFHELGHNHQVSDWTFNGTGEVTVNLFSLYIMETVCGLPMNAGHGALSEREKLVAKHKAKKCTFESWKSDPFLALIMYQQLREAFGWETYKRVFAEYRALKKEDRPKGEDAERDQWMVRFSRACGHNLGPFFEAWGVPTSEGARASIANLPPFMPADWPGK